MSCELGGQGDRRASPASMIDVGGAQKMDKKSGAPYTPIRCAFAFLVTPKLPAKRGEVLKLNERRRTQSRLIVNAKFSKSLTFIAISSN
jgi:hypothetical protein